VIVLERYVASGSLDLPWHVEQAENGMTPLTTLVAGDGVAQGLGVTVATGIGLTAAATPGLMIFMVWLPPSCTAPRL